MLCVDRLIIVRRTQILGAAQSPQIDPFSLTTPPLKLWFDGWIKV
jgi:hypothetical protein